jgi:hypothetical protein
MDTSSAAAIRRPQVRFKYILFVAFVLMFLFVLWDRERDVLGGVVVAAEAGPLIDEIRQIPSLEGAVPSPFDCWLIHRGIQSLPCRMRVHAANALAVAQALDV